MDSSEIQDNQGPSEVAAGNCGDVFPDVVTLADNPEDQEILLRVQAVWFEYAGGWSREMKQKLLRHLGDVRTDATNLDTPSKHKLYNSIELDFAVWVLLKCIYPEQPLSTLKALLVAKYPGLDPTSFVGPRLTSEGNEIKFVRVKKTKKIKKAKTTGSRNTAKPTPRVPERMVRAPGQPRPGERFPRFTDGPIYALRMYRWEAEWQSLKSKLSKKKPTGHEVPKGSSKDHAEFDEDLMSHFEFPKRSTGDGPSQAGLSGEQFKELKTRVLEAIMATHRDLVKEMHKANAETIKEIQNMQTKLDGGLVNGRENLSSIASEVSSLRAAIEVVRREQKDICG
ncbi:hypothetical protein FHETE_1285 [Fusarium heterosporum]|uniref:Uncharacterized protein n=1 Tax=Fusarium heterosporum TaxID=42747 RepID=A0A8H5TW69_FUSHE|nr:hypothetical protein FHETE_1285 [Fusarium heterosporum]